jgi:hypothetical protein
MRYVIGFIAIIVLVILTFVLIWRGVTGDGDPVETPAPLTDYTFTTTVMRFTIVGRVNADQDHRSVRMTISRSENRIEILEGYQEALGEARSYASNQEAYGTFLRSLDLLGFTQGSDDPERADDRGFCPIGQRYIYEIVDGTNVVQRYWSTSCRGDMGPFEGDKGGVRSLFQAQIPDYRAITRGVRL